MKNLFALFLLLVTMVGFSQENDKTKNAKWTIGFGANFIDNTSTSNNQYLNSSKQWNYIPSISKFSFEKSFSEKCSLEVAVAMNVISASKLQNGGTISEDLNYYGVDVNGKYFFDDFIAKQSKIDAYIVVGLGINSVDDFVNQTANYGLGLNFWIQPNLGFRLQTMGKQGFEQQTLLNNHIQHSAELIFKF